MLEEALKIPLVRQYQGQFEGGVANGMASITFMEGHQSFARFEGMVRQGRMNGIGKLTMKDGTVQEGQWTDNQLSIRL